MYASRVGACPFTKKNTAKAATRFAFYLLIFLATLASGGLTAQQTVQSFEYDNALKGYPDAELLAEESGSVGWYTPAVEQALRSEAEVARDTYIITYVTQAVVAGAVAYVAYRSGTTAVEVKLAVSGNRKANAEPTRTTIAQVEVTAVVVVEEDSAFVLRVKQIIASNYEEESFSLPALCHELSMSRSQLFRRLKAEASVAPSALIRSYRLEQARERLLGGATSVKEVAYSVGFREPAHFTRAFRDAYGVVPSSLLGK